MVDADPRGGGAEEGSKEGSGTGRIEERAEQGAGTILEKTQDSCTSSLPTFLLQREERDAPGGG